MHRAFEHLAHRRCPFCQKRIEFVSQQGQCAYFDPCGHRMGGGDAERLMKYWEGEGL